ncbi:hypothetical protein TR75_03310, partial [Hydrogenibacillus schlegelii]
MPEPSPSSARWLLGSPEESPDGASAWPTGTTGSADRLPLRQTFPVSARTKSEGRPPARLPRSGGKEGPVGRSLRFPAAILPAAIIRPTGIASLLRRRPTPVG